jgi:hypothetical protein
MNKYFVLALLSFCFEIVHAQLVEVQTDYNSIGDCVFSAHNNSETPIFLKIDFADLENTSFNEPLPYVKKLEPGFNSLFTLERNLDGGVPRFNYQIKSYRSNPTASVNLDFPYLVPLVPGSKVKTFDVNSIDGFWGDQEPKSWVAMGFAVSQGEAVYASRQGAIVEIVGANRGGDSQSWYHTWTNSITILQPDGTLICYRNVVDKRKMLELNQKIYAGQLLGTIAPNSQELILLIYKKSLSSDDLIFIIPQFVTEFNKIGIINPAMNVEVVHPNEVRGLEMSKKEKRKILGTKK